MMVCGIGRQSARSQTTNLMSPQEGSREWYWDYAVAHHHAIQVIRTYHGGVCFRGIRAVAARKDGLSGGR